MLSSSSNGLRLPADVNWGALKAICGRINSLEDEGIRSPLFGDRDGIEVCAEWNNAQNFGVFEDLETSELSKVGPYFNRPFEEWSSSVDAYFVGHKPYPFSDISPFPELDKYCDRVVEEIGSVGTPLGFDKLMRRVKRNTNLGLPLLTSDWSGSHVQSYLARAKRILLGEKAEMYPFVMFKRVQPGGPDPEDAKQRPVWGADHAETFAGLSVVYPILDAMRNRLDYFHLAGIDELEGAIKHAASKTARNNGWFISLDLSKCDATFGPPLILLGMNMVSRLVSAPTEAYRRLYEYYAFGDLITPDMRQRVGSHGIPSGISMTNLLETLVLKAIGYFAIEQLGLGEFHTFQNGDDGLLMIQKEPNLDQLTDVYATFGLKLNSGKSLVSQRAMTYLQRHFYVETNWDAVMSSVRMMGRIVYSERVPTVQGMNPRTYWTLNTIMKLENCKRHPDFADMVDFCRRGDDAGLVLPKRAYSIDLRDVTGYEPVSRNRVNDVENHMTTKSNGLANFETVKLLKP